MSAGIFNVQMSLWAQGSDGSKVDQINLSRLATTGASSSDVMAEQLRFMHANVSCHALDLLESSLSTDPTFSTSHDVPEADLLEGMLLAMRRPPCWQGTPGGATHHSSFRLATGQV